MKKERRADALIRKWMKNEKYRNADGALEPEYVLAATIIEARVKAKLSQRQLARKMRTTQPMIARMEKGRQPPSTATLLKFAKATGTRLQIRFIDA